MNATAKNTPEDGNHATESQADSSTDTQADASPSTPEEETSVDAQIKEAMEHATTAQPPLQEDETAALKDQLLRTMAEMENVRKRAQRDVEEASKYAVASFARELVSVLENLQRASESIPEGARKENDMLNTLGEGVELTLKELLGAFEKHGITRVNPLGEKFDHNFHQAVVQIDDPSHPPGTVVQVMQAGYLIADRLLRPAMVGVSKAPAAPEDTPPSVDTQA